MIEYVEGDIFISPAQVIVNTVNTVGVMGKGLALEYKNRYPDMFKAYQTACEKNNLKSENLCFFTPLTIGFCRFQLRNIGDTLQNWNILKPA